VQRAFACELRRDPALAAWIQNTPRILPEFPQQAEPAVAWRCRAALGGKRPMFVVRQREFIALSAARSTSGARLRCGAIVSRCA
jgi:hypothetical protein